MFISMYQNSLLVLCVSLRNLTHGIILRVSSIWNARETHRSVRLWWSPMDGANAFGRHIKLLRESHHRLSMSLIQMWVFSHCRLFAAIILCRHHRHSHIAYKKNGRLRIWISIHTSVTLKLLWTYEINKNITLISGNLQTKKQYRIVARSDLDMVVANGVKWELVPSCLTVIADVFFFSIRSGMSTPLTDEEMMDIMAPIVRCSATGTARKFGIASTRPSSSRSVWVEEK